LHLEHGAGSRTVSTIILFTASRSSLVARRLVFSRQVWSEVRPKDRYLVCPPSRISTSSKSKQRQSQSQKPKAKLICSFDPLLSVAPELGVASVLFYDLLLTEFI
jgi:hypothetical protein